MRGHWSLNFLKHSCVKWCIQFHSSSEEIIYIICSNRRLKKKKNFHKTIVTEIVSCNIVCKNAFAKKQIYDKFFCWGLCKQISILLFQVRSSILRAFSFFFFLSKGCKWDHTPAESTLCPCKSCSERLWNEWISHWKTFNKGFTCHILQASHFTVKSSCPTSAEVSWVKMYSALSWFNPCPCGWFTGDIILLVSC